MVSLSFPPQACFLIWRNADRFSYVHPLLLSPHVFPGAIACSFFEFLSLYRESPPHPYSSCDSCPVRANFFPSFPGLFCRKFSRLLAPTSSFRILLLDIDGPSTSIFGLLFPPPLVEGRGFPTQFFTRLSDAPRHLSLVLTQKWFLLSLCFSLFPLPPDEIWKPPSFFPRHS